MGISNCTGYKFVKNTCIITEKCQIQSWKYCWIFDFLWLCTLYMCMLGLFIQLGSAGEMLPWIHVQKTVMFYTWMWYIHLPYPLKSSTLYSPPSLLHARGHIKPHVECNHTLKVMSGSTETITSYWYVSYWCTIRFYYTIKDMHALFNICLLLQKTEQ